MSKFRFWSDQLQKYIDNVALDTDGNACSFDCDGVAEIEYGDVELFTGLKDKNGLEVYESDLCRADGLGVCSIAICPMYGVLFVDTASGAEHTAAACVTVGHSFEVIGNIHENSDLINKTNKGE